MLERDADWIWDSWYVVDGLDLHAFYLMAPKSLGDPQERHWNASVGHSVSRDGVTWTHLAQALAPSADHGFDNKAIWTGSIVKSGDTWHLFYTGISNDTSGRVQAVGHATSTDLLTWTRADANPVLRAAPPLAVLDTAPDGYEHFRDPWVFFHDGEWHMLVTSSEPSGWGTIAHATSRDLESWEPRGPLVTASELKQLEVTQMVESEGRWYLLFCMGPGDVVRQGVPRAHGTYCVPADGPLGPYHLDRAEVLAPGIYAARAVFLDGGWKLLGFLDNGEQGGFQGVICAPLSLRPSGRGTLEIAR